MKSHCEFTESLSDAILRGASVLVVEDCWHVAAALKSLLEDIGLEVIGLAPTMFDAERLAAEHRPELAVIDVNLNGEMAYSLIDRLHDQGVRIVVVTGYAELPQAVERIAAIVRKPFSGSELLAALRKVRSGCYAAPSCADGYTSLLPTRNRNQDARGRPEHSDVLHG